MQGRLLLHSVILIVSFSSHIFKEIGQNHFEENLLNHKNLRTCKTNTALPFWFPIHLKNIDAHCLSVIYKRPKIQEK